MNPPFLGNGRLFRPQNRCFTLVELLVAITVLIVLVVLLSQMLIMTGNIWKMGRAQADNFSQARTALDLMGRDVEAGVIRPDLPAFSVGGAPALAFYTRQQGLKTSTQAGNRDLSAVSYSVVNAGGTNSFLRRSAGGLDYGDAVNYSPASWTMPSGTTSFDSDLGPGVLLMKYQFIGTNGLNVLPDQINPAWTNSASQLGVRSLRAVVISLVVMDGETMKLTQDSGKLSRLQSNFSVLDPGAIRSYRSEWQDQINDASHPLAGGGIPLQAVRGLRTFERTFMLPQPLGQ